MPYPIIRVLDDAADITEALGTKPKFWYDAGRMLYKEGRSGSGDHWAEKVCCEICKLLGLPHADYELAEWRGRQGVVTPNFVPEGGRLVLGNELLAKKITGYAAMSRFGVRQHTVRAVMIVLGAPAIGPPAGFAFSSELPRARDFFVGYLMLDALVGNQDRHHENWGLVVGPRDPVNDIRLAPSFDHASSLGRNERDEERKRRLSTRDRGSQIDAYVRRARSAFFLSSASPNPLSTLAAFKEGGRLARRAEAYWLRRLQGLEMADFASIFDGLPSSEISIPARDFALAMLEANRSRLIAGLK